MLSPETRVCRTTTSRGDGHAPGAVRYRSRRADAHGLLRTGAQFTNDPMTRAMLCAISLSSGNDSIPITEYPRSHGIR